MKTLRSHEGYLMIDHRAGAGTDQVPAGRLYETGIKLCSHCQRQIILNPLRSRERAYCPSCDHYICDTCEAVRVATGVCKPFRQVMDEIVEAAVKQETKNG